MKNYVRILVMRGFRNRTLALVLASVVTVVGAFAANNYKNSLMGLQFSKTDGAVSMVVQTKSVYDGTVTPIRKNANTYTLLLPEVNSEAATPDLNQVSSDIASVNIRTMPYSNTSKGYTVITVTTKNSSTNLAATSQLFIGNSSNNKQIQNTYNKVSEQKSNNTPKKNLTSETSQKKKIGKIETNEEIEDSEGTEVEETPVVEPTSTAGLIEAPYVPAPVHSQPIAGRDNTFLWLWAILIVLVTTFFYAKAKTKIQDLVGESIDINVNDDDSDKKKKTKKINKIKKTINTLDETYSKTSKLPVKSEYTIPTQLVKTVKPAEELNIVDLDEIFQEHKSKNTTDNANTVEEEIIPQTEEDENSALEDFLSGFSFDDTEEPSEEENEFKYDEEYYEKTINDDSIRFSKEEIDCIEQLLNMEVNDETIKNIEQYAVSNPIPVKVSKEKMLEDIVTNYAVSQNIHFASEDIHTLYKLLNVELDEGFITDLRTNPQKTIEMEKDILVSGEKQKKPSEIITLKVKDMLPDLSEAMRKQGNKKIESNYKADTVYYSEGYEVSTLSLDETLPDLSVEINKKESYISKPSADYEIVDSNYTVGDSILKIASELPDLEDVLAHPEKYETSPAEEVVVDEKALLNNIANVQFKPFYDGTNEFEVLNDIESAPSVSDIQKEFSQFEGFEIAPEENFEKNPIQDEYDDFQSLYNNEYVDLDKEELAETTVVEKSPVEENVVTKQNDTKQRRTSSAQELIKKIEATKIEREIRKARLAQKENVRKVKVEQHSESTETIRFIFDKQTHTVISSAAIDDTKGCYLAKNSEGYAVLGYIGEKLTILKQYETLKSEKLHVRFSEKISDKISRYIVRIGLQKFVVNVTDDNIEFVMDLC